MDTMRMDAGWVDSDTSFPERKSSRSSTISAGLPYRVRGPHLKRQRNQTDSIAHRTNRYNELYDSSEYGQNVGQERNEALHTTTLFQLRQHGNSDVHSCGIDSYPRVLHRFEVRLSQYS